MQKFTKQDCLIIRKKMKFTKYQNKVVLTRVESDSEGNKTRTKLGNIRFKNMQFSDGLLDSLSEDEKEEVNAWIDNKRHLISMQKELAAKTLVNNIKDACDWLVEADTTEAAGLYKEIRQANRRMRKILRNKGVIVINDASKT